MVTDESTLSEPSTGVLEAVIDAHGEFAVVLDGEGLLRRWTGGFERVVDRDDLDGTPLAAVVEDGAAVEAALAEVHSTGTATVDVALGAPPERYEIRLAPGENGVVGSGRPRPAGPVDDQHVADRTTDAVFSLDDDWVVTYANGHAESLLAEAMAIDPGSEVVGRHLWESTPDAVNTLFYERYHEAMETQEPVTFEAAYEPLETVFEVRAYPSETGLSVYLRDITERREQREAMAERERALTTMHAITSDADRDFRSQVEALIDLGRDLLDADHGVLSRVTGEEYRFEVTRSPSAAFEAGLRVPLSATICERTVTEQRRVVLADIAEDAPAAADRVAESDHEWGDPVNCYVGAPVLVDGEVYGTFCFYDGDTREDGFTEWETTVVEIMAQWVGYELTRQRTSERLRRQNERLEEFVSVVSHDLRNPLETLSGHLEYAEETGDAEHFEWCYRAVDRMESLIDDLLTLARAGDTVGDTEPVALDALVEECWAIVDGDAELVVETDRTVHADRSRLRQLLENLLGNAVQHAGPGVTVTVGDTEDGFYVADDGPGIPETDREQVFEAGYSTETDGTGFGLQIVEQVAEAHGWSVRLVESETGGARFEFTL